MKEGITSGINIAQDVLSGQNLKSSLKRRARGSGRRLLKRAIGEFTATPGEPAVKRRRPLKRSRNRSNKSKPVKDIFG